MQPLSVWATNTLLSGPLHEALYAGTGDTEVDKVLSVPKGSFIV